MKTRFLTVSILIACSLALHADPNEQRRAADQSYAARTCTTSTGSGIWNGLKSLFSFGGAAAQTYKGQDATYNVISGTNSYEKAKGAYRDNRTYCPPGDYTARETDNQRIQRQQAVDSQMQRQQAERNRAAQEYQQRENERIRRLQDQHAEWHAAPTYNAQPQQRQQQYQPQTYVPYNQQRTSQSTAPTYNYNNAPQQNYQAPVYVPYTQSNRR